MKQRSGQSFRSECVFYIISECGKICCDILNGFRNTWKHRKKRVNSNILKEDAIKTLQRTTQMTHRGNVENVTHQSM